MISQKNQAVPYSVITGGTSEVNYSTSTITATSNTQLMVTPNQQSKRWSRIDRESNGETNNVNLIEQSGTKKRKNDIITTTDTITTIENERRTEPSHHDEENGEGSKQHHDVQKVIESPIIH